MPRILSSFQLFARASHCRTVHALSSRIPVRQQFTFTRQFLFTSLISRQRYQSVTPFTRPQYLDDILESFNFEVVLKVDRISIATNYVIYVYF
jgi:hypothetical protein